MINNCAGDGSIQISDLENRVVEKKKALFDKMYSFLNERQREAVYTVNGPLLVLAGAGSGKTTVLVHRIAHIIKYGNAYNDSRVSGGAISEEMLEKLEKAGELEDDDTLAAVLSEYAVDACPPWGILSITFTNKAANEMKIRLEKVIGDAAKDIWAGTFHSICMRILRKHGERVGYKSGFTIYDTEDSKKLINKCIKDLGIDEKMLPAKTVLSQISAAKSKLLTPEEFMNGAEKDSRLIHIGNVYSLYQKLMAASNVLDFDDIIMQTVKLLKTDSEVREYYQHRFKYVCVDEFQDTNRAQLELALLLSGKYNNLMVVGDDDQSIYKFRGATIENILNFDHELNNAKIIKLEQNYRSTQTILNAANAVIHNNNGRRGKELWTENGEGTPIMLRRLDNQHEEARFIINKITDMVIREKRKLSDFAVLYRVNAQSNNLEQVFAKSGLAYRILGGVRFYERKEIKDIIAYLCVVNNTGDDLRLTRIINEPKRKIGDTTVSAVEKIAFAEGITMFDVMEHADQYIALAKSATKLMEFTYLIRKLQEISRTESLPVLFEKTIELSGYRDMILSMGDSEIDRLENIQELVSNAVEYSNNNETPTLNGFLEEVALVSDIDNYDDEANAVVLMTIHSAKGLEFPVVFLPGMEEGLFPGMQSTIYPEDLEEERRLAYVAITRAKEKLFVTHVRERLIYGRTQYNKLSRFITEIPDELLDKERPKEKAVAENNGEKPTKRKNVISKEFFKKTDITNGAESSRSSGYVQFSPGDVVVHPTFGRGEILTARIMGADILYEIAFETKGTKKLMATYAKLKAAD